MKLNVIALTKVIKESEVGEQGNIKNLRYFLRLFNGNILSYERCSEYYIPIPRTYYTCIEGTNQLVSLGYSFFDILIAAELINDSDLYSDILEGIDLFAGKDSQTIIRRTFYGHLYGRILNKLDAINPDILVLLKEKYPIFFNNTFSREQCNTITFMMRDVAQKVYSAFPESVYAGGFWVFDISDFNEQTKQIRKFFARLYKTLPVCIKVSDFADASKLYK